MSIDWMTTLADKLERAADARPRWASPLDLAQALDPTVKRTPVIELINQKLVEAYNTPDARLMVCVSPQSGKSQLCSRWLPLWLLTQNPDARITLASYETAVARRWGRAVRDQINQDSESLGMSIRDDVSAQNEWEIEGHRGGMFTAGVGSALTGRPSDGAMIIDDPVKNYDEAISKVKQETAFAWWTGTAQTRLHPGTPVILIMTRWATGDLGGRILSEPGGEDWEVLSIPAQADHDPAKGETDPLGREPGEFHETVHGMTVEQWEQRKIATGPKAWRAMYQQSPTLDEGGIFPPEWPRYSQPMWVEVADGSRRIPGLRENGYELIQSWDLSFKDADSSDYVVGQVWLRVGVNMYLLDMVRERLNFTATLDKIKYLRAKWPEAVAVLIEDRANGPAVITALSKDIPGIIPVEPEGSKVARASAISPLAHAGNMILPTSALLPNVEEFVEEAKGFPGAAHDDSVDSATQAASYLLLHPLIDQEQLVAEEFADDAPLISPF